jgi:hypothetical protein
MMPATTAQERPGAPEAHQQQHEGRSDDAKPKLLFHWAHAKAGERQPKPKLKPGRNGRRQDARQTANDAGRADQEKECANNDAGSGDRARLHRLDQHSGRCGLHRLHRHRHAVKSSRQRVKDTEGRQNASRCHADDRNRADNMRQEGSKIAKRARNLADTPAKARTGAQFRYRSLQSILAAPMSFLQNRAYHRYIPAALRKPARSVMETEQLDQIPRPARGLLRRLG